MTVVVEVADGDAVTVSPRQFRDARRRSHVLERPVAPVAEQPVALLAVGAKRDRRREGAALDDVDVEPAVAVVIEQPDASRGRLGELPAGRAAIVEGEAQARGLGVIAE